MIFEIIVLLLFFIGMIALLVFNVKTKKKERAYKHRYRKLSDISPDKLSIEEKAFVLLVEQGYTYGAAARKSKLSKGKELDASGNGRKPIVVTDEMGRIKKPIDIVIKVISVTLAMFTFFLLADMCEIGTRFVTSTFVFIVSYGIVSTALLYKEDFETPIERLKRESLEERELGEE